MSPAMEGSVALAPNFENRHASTEMVGGVAVTVSVNGKLRDVIRVAAMAPQADIEATALKAEKAQRFLVGKTVKKVIVVQKKLVNIVVV